MHTSVAMEVGEAFCVVRSRNQYRVSSDHRYSALDKCQWPYKCESPILNCLNSVIYSIWVLQQIVSDCSLISWVGVEAFRTDHWCENRCYLFNLPAKG
jgi:hypothetical protein